MNRFTSSHAFALAALAAGLTLLGVWAANESETRDYQRRAAAVLDSVAATPSAIAPPRVEARTLAVTRTPHRARAERPSAARRARHAAPADRTRDQARMTGVIGRLSIPRLGVSGMIAEGVSERTLERAIGHVPGTPLPGERGNVSLAGHRDSFFRRLERVRKGDHIRVRTADGAFTYRVTGTRVVGPHSVEVLWNEPHPTLTLVTCYPFNAIGPAPRRWVVQADLVGEDETRAARARPEPPARES